MNAQLTLVQFIERRLRRAFEVGAYDEADALLDLMRMHLEAEAGGAQPSSTPVGRDRMLAWIKRWLADAIAHDEVELASVLRGAMRFLPS